jgi:AcrR family transcriptional regulator
MPLSEAGVPAVVNKRDQQRHDTYNLIVDAAVDSMIENGYAATTALGVQKRTGVSRGALLHHFPTSEALSAAAVERLVELNLQAMQDELAAAEPDPDPVARGVRVIYRASRRKTFATELELWGAARANQPLRSALLAAERKAHRRLHTVIEDIFGPETISMAGYQAMVELTVQFMRGLTISRAIGRGRGQDELVTQWTSIIRLALDNNSAPAPNRAKRGKLLTDNGR